MTGNCESFSVHFDVTELKVVEMGPFYIQIRCKMEKGSQYKVFNRNQRLIGKIHTSQFSSPGKGSKSWVRNRVYITTLYRYHLVGIPGMRSNNSLFHLGVNLGLENLLTAIHSGSFTYIHVRISNINIQDKDL